MEQNSGFLYSDLKRHGKRVGGCFAFYIAVQIAASLGLSVISTKGVPLAFTYAYSGIMLSFLALFVPFRLMSRKQGSLSYWEVLPFNLPKDKLRSVLLIFFGWAVCMLSNQVSAFVELAFNNAGYEIADQQLGVSSSLLDFVATAVVSSLFAPLVEEFVFRGVIMQPLRRYGKGFAVVVSAVLFGMAHGTPTTFAFAFVCGLVIGYATLSSGSLWVGIAIHFLNNAYATVFIQISEMFPNSANRLYFVGMVVILALGAVSAVVLWQNGCFKKSELYAECRLSLSAKIRGFFLNLPMICSLCLLAWLMSFSVQ